MHAAPHTLSTNTKIASAPGYLAHFGLHSAPFSHENLPFFAGANRGVTLSDLLYALTCDEGLIKLAGDAGSGKTTLLRLLAQRLPESVACVHIAAHAGLSDDGLLGALAKALNLKVPADALPVVARHLLHERLSERRAQGLTTAVLIDDAHLLPPDALEEIGLLSAHESNGRKTLLFVLAGLPELNAALTHDDARALKERITHNFTLDALMPDETAAYLDLRLCAAGHAGPSLIEPAAAHLISAAANGSIQRINQLADLAMQTAGAAGHRVVGLDDMCDLPRNTAPTVTDPGQKRKRGIFYGSVLIAVAALTAGGIGLYRSRPAPTVEPAPPSPVTPQKTAAAPAPTPPSPIVPVADAQEQASPTTETSTESLTRQRLDAGSAWLKHAKNSHWFIQIIAMDADQTEQIESFLQKLANDLPPEQTRAYLGKRDGVPRLGVIYGDFASQADALRALSALPPSVRENQPYLRQVNKLR